jgi:sugar/nucleoside kinase (ribokinase family)
MNIDECSVLLQEKLESPEALQSAAQRIAEAGPAQVLITLGSNGAFVYWRDDRESWKLIPASIGTHVVVDTTGCGDCFAAGYIWGLFRYDDPVKATCAANVVAGENCRFIGLIRDLDVNEIEVMASRLHSQVFHR